MARLVLGRCPLMLVRRLRVDFPLRLSVLTLVHAHVEGLLDRVTNVDLGGAGIHDEDVDVLVHEPVALLGHHGPDQH